MQELTLQAQTAAQTRDFRSQLTSFLARTAAGNAQIDRREHSGRAEHENNRGQPEAAFAKRAAQQLEDDIREMLSLHGVFEQGLELYLRLRSRNCARILAANSTVSKGNEITSSAPRSKARARSTAPP